VGTLALVAGRAQAGPPRLPDPRSLAYPGRDQATPLRVELGKSLFFDGRLSSTGTMSCSTCHKPELGFGDGQRFSVGVKGHPMKRHTPHLFNLAWSKTLFWDGRATSLEEQVLGPLSSPEELDMPIAVLVERLRTVPAYASRFSEAYPRSGLTTRNVASAIAAFVRTLVSGGSPFDRFLAGEASALGPEARRGMDLFYGRAACSTCHSGPHLTDGKFHNTGVPGDDRGRAALDRVGEFQMRPYPFFQTQKAFKTPSLRNVALTAPYLHDGSEPSLEEIVRFYNRGGKEKESYGLALDIRPLNLTDDQLADLVAFLQALTAPVEVTPPVIPDPQVAWAPASRARSSRSDELERESR
jgi:cytochrome c peroxidase